ncbi:MAG: methylenetetrahydrofolate reductase [NAD(P)H] [Pirellulales bacterium]|nr:methylenetetrahydrofolate reductase [NAD(P)H] [Pirellulales bacterium]
MRLSEAYGPGKFGLSFELFPPKTAAGEESMYRSLDELMRFRPSFVTCTYGAGGSTREKTLDICQTVHRRYGLPVASHLTCVGNTVAELRAYLSEAGSRGISNIVALRGDPPKGETRFTAVDGGLCWASELVNLIHTEFPRFGIAVAGYPEIHQEATSAADDLQNLSNKVALGGEIVITQLFYDNADYFGYVEQVRKLGVTVPIVPGILPVTNFAQIQRIASLCKARLPEEFAAALSAAGMDEAAQFEIGVEFATRQVRELVAAGVPGIHFYVLNKSAATMRVLESAGIQSS